MTELKKLEEKLSTYETLKFSDEQEEIWLANKNKTLKDFALFFFTKSKASYTSKVVSTNKKIRTGGYARSLIEFLLHCRYYFPSSSYLDIFEVLFFEKPLHFRYCGDIKRLVCSGQLTSPIYNKKDHIKIALEIPDIFLDDLFNEVKTERFKILTFLNKRINESKRVVIKDEFKKHFIEIKTVEIKKFLDTFASKCNNSESTIFSESKKAVSCGGDQRSLIDTYSCYCDLFDKRAVPLKLEPFIFALYKAGYGLFKCENIGREVIHFCPYSASKMFNLTKGNGEKLMEELKRYLGNV